MEHDGLFIHVNDSIRKLATDDLPTQTWEFVCECPEVGCRAPVTLTLLEFDERRSASPPLPVLADEHGDGDSIGLVSHG
jgi:hypothetical protein